MKYWAHDTGAANGPAYADPQWERSCGGRGEWAGHWIFVTSWLHPKEFRVDSCNIYPLSCWIYRGCESLACCVQATQSFAWSPPLFLLPFAWNFQSASLIDFYCKYQQSNTDGIRPNKVFLISSVFLPVWDQGRDYWEWGWEWWRLIFGSSSLDRRDSHQHTWDLGSFS